MADHDPRFVELDPHPQQGPDTEERRIITGPVLGAAIGLVAGIVVLVVADRANVVGDASNPAAWFGLPGVGAIIGFVVGMLLSAAGRSGEDAPVRDRRYLRRRRAATSEHLDLVERR